MNGFRREMMGRVAWLSVKWLSIKSITGDYHVMSNYIIRSKRVFITGAASGIGYALALAFAREGADIVATDISSVGLDKLRPEVEALGVECRTEILDVADATAFDTLADKLVIANQLPDIVINNAGIGIGKSFMDTTKQDWDLLFNINVHGVINGCKIFTRLWLDRGIAGHLVNTCSSVAIAPTPNMAAYSASKAAAFALTEALAGELSETDIRVTAVCPGAINTNIVNNEELNNLPPKTLATIQKYYREKGTDPAEVAAAVVIAVKKNKPVIFVGNGATSVNIARRFLTARAFRNMMVKVARQLGMPPIAAVTGN